MDARIGRFHRLHPRCGRDRLNLRRRHRRDSRAGGKEYEQDDRERAKHGAAGLGRGWWREEGDVVNDKPLASRLQEKRHRNNGYYVTMNRLAGRSHSSEAASWIVLNLRPAVPAPRRDGSRCLRQLPPFRSLSSIHRIDDLAPRFAWRQPASQSPIFSASMNAACGISTLPNWRMRFLPSFCLSSSLRLRVTSPP